GSFEQEHLRPVRAVAAEGLGGCQQGSQRPQAQREGPWDQLEENVVERVARDSSKRCPAAMRSLGAGEEGERDQRSESHSGPAERAKLPPFLVDECAKHGADLGCLLSDKRRGFPRGAVAPRRPPSLPWT